MKALFSTLTFLAALSIVYWVKHIVYTVSYNESTKDVISVDYNEREKDDTYNVDVPDSVLKIATSRPTVDIVTPPLKYQPYRNIVYKTSGQNDNRSVFIIPRRAYLDNRIHLGKQRNVVLILAQVHDEAVNSVVACELNGFFSESVSVIKENTWWVRKFRPGYTHCTLVIECLGLPSKSIVNGSVPKLIYKKSGEDYYSFVASEKPLILRSVTSTPARGKGSVVVCTTMFGHPENFNHWLKYQKTIGVDSVHLNTDPTFFDNATVLYPFLKESLNNGFVSIEVWNDVVNKRVFYYEQVTKYQDCVFRHINIFEYMFIYDCDDYFNPLVSSEKNVHYYLDQYFSSSNVGTVYIQWWTMECKPVEEKLKTLQDGNLTSILSGYRYSKRTEAKCAHRVDALKFVLVHDPQSSLFGYTSIRGKDALAYVAHNRYDTKQCS